MRKRNRLLTAAVALGFGLSLAGVAAPAMADDWAKHFTCNANNRCAMSSNTSSGVTYRIDNVIRASWGTGGAHSGNYSVSAGYRQTLMSTPGVFYSHAANCYCPGGVSCPV